MAQQQTLQPSVFLSIGRPLSSAQEAFKLALVSTVKARGFVPRTVGSRPEDSDVPHDRPIEQITKIIRECDGAVIVAYEKHLADVLHTNSLASHPGRMSDVRLPTSWNQAEAAMAYHSGLPLLLISEEGLFGECLLEDGVIGSVARVEINESAVWNDVFQRRMTSWAADVTSRLGAKRANKFRDTDADQLTIRDLLGIFSSMNWKSGLILGGVVAGILSGVYTLGFFSHLFFK
jgi:hypothetical protein